MMLDTSHKKARFSLRKTALGLVSALLGVLLLSAYVPNLTNSLVYAQANVSQNRSVMVHYVLESELTEQEKLAVQSGFPNHTNDGDSVYFVYKSLKQDLPKTSDEGAFWLSLLGIGLAGVSFMVIKTSKPRKGFLGLALVLVGGLSVTTSANWSEQLSYFNQVFLLSQNEVLPAPPEIAGYRYLGYIYKPAKTSVSSLVPNQVETEIALETLENEERTVVSESAPSVDLPSHILSSEEIYEVVPSDYPTVESLPTYELSSDVAYTVVPEDSPSVDLPIHILSLEDIYDVVPSDYPTVESLPTYELSSDVAYTVVPETAPSVDLPIHPLSLEEVYEVVPSDYPIVEPLPTYELSSDVAYTVVPEDSPSVDLPIHTLSPEDIYEVVPSGYPIVDPLPTYELSSDVVYTVVPEDSPTFDLPSHTLSLEEFYEVIPSDYPIVESLPTHELTTDAVYTVVPSDYPIVESLPDFDVSSLPKTTDVNDNWVDYVAEDGSDRRILWAKGVKGLRMGAGGDFKKSTFGDYVDYKAPFVLDNGWYDANKRRDGDSRIDASLCFATVSTNMLYWWLDQNKEEVGRYLEELEKSGHFDNIEANTIKDLRYLVSQPGVQQDSTIYNLFVNYFYDRFNGYQSDILMDFFINGYAPKPGGGTNDEDQEFVKDQRAGFFNAIFGNKKLTKRQFSGSYQTFSQTVKTALENNQLIGMEHLLSSRLNHIVTLWGAEFDADNRLVAVYVTDSDDQDDYRQLGMKRYLVKDVGGRVKVSTDISQSNKGSNIEYLHILSLGKEYWETYFEGNP